ncbi:HNH endonuclease signature motif containing protein [Methanobrevibacter olleyae]|uniref:Phage-related protein n=1 Tax=Methanobrevibacter olleyae TaxID=294671 RepID=A0A126R2J4_METOL|nr:HNH endonuclease signature motif containing protein [Methanobrevibacter olleyae]AMK16292.1 phage-related protein [Methanobrevibacter olleyae]
MGIKTRFGNAYKRRDGYYQITSGIYKGKLLHRLVYEKERGPIPEGFVVHHLDNNKANYDINNLILLSKSNHHRLHMRGCNHPRWNKGRIDEAGGINFLSAEKNKGRTMSSIAEELGYTQAVPVFQYLKYRNLRWNQI